MKIALIKDDIIEEVAEANSVQEFVDANTTLCAEYDQVIEAPAHKGCWFDYSINRWIDPPKHIAPT